MKRFWKALAEVRGKNSAATPVDVIRDQLHEPRPLPLGMTEFHQWADRIIAGAMIEADPPSMKFALANQLMHLGPTEDHKEDIFFIKTLRKFAVNQIADGVRRQLHEERKAATAAIEAEEAAKAKAAAEAAEEAELAKEIEAERLAEEREVEEDLKRIHEQVTSQSDEERAAAEHAANLNTHRVRE